MQDPSDTSPRLKKASQQLARAQRQYALETFRQRKQDVHRKIKLGGLFIKAGLDQYSPSALLGLLDEARLQLEEDPQRLEDWQRRGDNLFNSSL